MILFETYSWRKDGVRYHYLVSNAPIPYYGRATVTTVCCGIHITIARYASEASEKELVDALLNGEYQIGFPRVNRSKQVAKIKQLMLLCEPSFIYRKKNAR